MSLHPYGFDPPKPPRRRCYGESCGLRFDADGQLVPRSRPGALRRLLQRLRKDAS